MPINVGLYAIDKGLRNKIILSGQLNLFYFKYYLIIKLKRSEKLQFHFSSAQILLVSGPDCILSPFAGS